MNLGPFQRVFETILDEPDGDRDDEEGEEDILWFFLILIIGSLVTIVLLLLLLPIAIGNDRKSWTEQIWMYRWTYLPHFSVGVFLFSFIYLGTPHLVAGGLASAVFVGIGIYLWARIRNRGIENWEKYARLSKTEVVALSGIGAIVLPGLFIFSAFGRPILYLSMVTGVVVSVVVYLSWEEDSRILSACAAVEDNECGDYLVVADEVVEDCEDAYEELEEEKDIRERERDTAIPEHHEMERVDPDMHYYPPVIDLPDQGSIGVVGAARSGKTELIKQLLSQMENARDEPKIIYERKDDYKQEIPDKELIRLSSRDGNVYWNIFREVDPESAEADFRELSRLLFAHKSDPFFQNTAAAVLYAILVYLWRDSPDNITPTNADLMEFINQADTEDLAKELEAHPDLFGAVRDALSSESDRMAASVLQTLRTELQQVFVGRFSESGEFSIREYMRDPEGKVLLLDQHEKESETARTIFKLLLDWSIEETMTNESRSYYLLDEFARLHQMEKIGDLLNVGPGKNVTAVIGIQSVNQVYATYGHDRGGAILAGLLVKILLRANDRETAEWQQSSIGDERFASISMLEKMGQGEAFIVRPDGWTHVQLSRAHDAERVLSRIDEMEYPWSRPK